MANAKLTHKTQNFQCLFTFVSCKFCCLFPTNSHTRGFMLSHLSNKASRGDASRIPCRFAKLVFVLNTKPSFGCLLAIEFLSASDYSISLEQGYLVLHSGWGSRYGVFSLVKDLVAPLILLQKINDLWLLTLQTDKRNTLRKTHGSGSNIHNKFNKTLTIFFYNWLFYLQLFCAKQIEFGRVFGSYNTLVCWNLNVLPGKKPVPVTRRLIIITSTSIQPPRRRPMYAHYTFAL